MTDHTRKRQARIVMQQCGEHSRERVVLGLGVGPIIGAFEFDADRIVVAPFAAPMARHARVPGTSIERHELGHRTASRDQQVARHAYALQVRKRWVERGVEAVREQRIDQPRAELSRRQRYPVHHDERNILGVRTRAGVRRSQSPYAPQPMIDGDLEHILANMEPDADTVKRNVAAALAEDVGGGDISADLIQPDARARARIVTREPGVLCGRPWAEETCRQVDPAIRLDWQVDDGAPIEPGDPLLDLDGPARGLLTAERTVLNFLQLLSGTATRTRHYVDAVASTGAVILDTRKTLPGLRAAQKYAVRIGGGRNHRMGLYDAILLKENHIATAGGIAAAVCGARSRHPGKPIEVEVEDPHELAEAIAASADRILLDNFSVDELNTAVATNAGRVPLEASGGITLDNVAAVARTGVDYISIGELTKSVTPLDLSMRFLPWNKFATR